MPPKITSKNLSYSSAPPPFLAALQAQASGQRAAGPDPVIAGQRRGVKKRSQSEEAEDEPLVVDEDGNEVTLDEDGQIQPGRETTPTGKEGDPRSKEEEDDVAGDVGGKVGIGAGARKRKGGRVVGGAEEEDQDPKAHNENTKGPPIQPKAKDGAKDDMASKALKSKKKSKTKKIKLSFDDDEDEGG